MSDELMEGRALRSRPPEPAPVIKPASKDKSARLKGRKKPKPEDEKSGPYVTLVPPDEAGDAILAQAEQPTLHKGMKPVLEEDKPPRRSKRTRARRAAEPRTPAAEDEPSTPAPDLPWDVIEPAPPIAPEPAAEPIMKLPRVQVEQAETKAKEKPPAPPTAKPGDMDFIPHFHTPTGELPPVKDVPAIEEEIEAEAGERVQAQPEAPQIQQISDSATPGILRRVPAEEDEESQEAIPAIRRTARQRPVEEQEEGGESVRFEADSQGGLPRLRPISDEPSGEVVDADWVREVGETAQPIHRTRGRDIEEAIAEKLEARRAKARRKSGLRLSARNILTAISILALIALVIYVPWRLNLFGSRPAGQKTPAMSPADLTSTAVVLAGSHPAPAATPSMPTASTPLAPYQRGKLAFASSRDGNYEIYVMDMVSGAISRLTNNTVADRFPAWSPDGRQIAYVSNGSGNDDLYVVPATGGTPSRITSDPGSDRNPAWSPDGKTIVFSRETVEGSRLVSLPTSCLAQPATCEGSLKLLTPGGYDRFPAWSPDGSKLAFAASDLPGSTSRIALLNPDGSGFASFAGTKTSDLSPAWSPDGKRIAFLSYAEGDYDLWVMNSDGSGVTQVTKSNATDGAPAWSPDGGYLVFASDRGDKQHFNLYLIRADCPTPDSGCEANLIRLTNDAADDLDPAWLPG